jgi:hypothetical protein
MNSNMFNKVNNNFHVNSWEEEKWKEGGELTWG